MAPQIKSIWGFLVRIRLVTMLLMLVAGFSVGWYSSSYKWEKNTASEETTVIEEITLPDGTKKTKKTTDTKKTAVVTPSNDYSVGVALEVGGMSDLMIPKYRLDLGRRLVWDIWLTASYSTSGTASVGFSYEF